MANSAFADLKKKIPSGVHPVIDALEKVYTGQLEAGSVSNPEKFNAAIKNLDIRKLQSTESALDALTPMFEQLNNQDEVSTAAKKEKSDAGIPQIAGSGQSGAKNNLSMASKPLATNSETGEKPVAASSQASLSGRTVKIDDLVFVPGKKQPPATTTEISAEVKNFADKELKKMGYDSVYTPESVNRLVNEMLSERKPEAATDGVAHELMPLFTDLNIERERKRQGRGTADVSPQPQAPKEKLSFTDPTVLWSGAAIMGATSMLAASKSKKKSADGEEQESGGISKMAIATGAAAVALAAIAMWKSKGRSVA